MKISRRDFLKWSAAAAIALKLDFDIDKANLALAADTDPPIIWLNGSGCSGCTISMLNVTNPTTIDDVLINKISMKYNSSLITQAGEAAIQSLDNAANNYKGSFILVIEGAIPTAEQGNYCVIGEKNGVPITILQAIQTYGPMAKYVVAAGSCASFGGVPASAPNTTSCSTVSSILLGKTTNPVINLPSCPVHPTVLIQTLLDIILTGTPRIDSYNRPTKYYSNLIHQNCPRRGTSGAKAPGQVGCYKGIGCKGPNTKSICSQLKWNNGVNWCVESNTPCIGCSNPDFPTNPIY